MTVTSATGETSFALSDTAVKAGATRLVWQREPYDHAALHRFLGRWIYHDQTLIDLAQPAFWGALALFLGGLIGARSQHVVHARAWRARYSARRRRTTARAPAIIDYVTSTPRSPAPPSASADRPSNHVHVPHPCTAAREFDTRHCGWRRDPSTRIACTQSPGSWPDPFFK